MKRIFLLITVIIIVILGKSCQNSHKKEAITAEWVLAQIHEPVIPANTINVLDYGAIADSLSNCKPATDKALAALNELGGGKLVFPAGNYHFNGPIHLISNMELHLEEGATIRFGSNPADYLPVVLTSWEGTFLYNYSPFIYARNCENIAITGQGTIDGEASETWQHWRALQAESQQLSRQMNHAATPLEERIFGEGHFLRPHLVQFLDCKNIKIEGIRVEDSPFWCIHLLRSENIIVRNISFEAFNKNNDGIDPEYSRNVLIEGVQFNNGDDNVAIKAGRDHEGRSSAVGTENIVIRNCHFKGLHAVVIGSEMSAGVQNVFVYDCTYAGYLKRGIYLKSNPDRGGFIRNLFVNNVEFGDVEDCIYITSFYHNQGEGHATQISDIYIENVSCKRASGTGIVIQGFPDKKVSDVYLSNVRIDEAENAISMINTERIIFSDVIIGKLATAPSAVH